MLDDADLLRGAAVHPQEAALARSPSSRSHAPPPRTTRSARRVGDPSAPRAPCEASGRAVERAPARTTARTRRRHRRRSRTRAAAGRRRRRVDPAALPLGRNRPAPPATRLRGHRAAADSTPHPRSRSHPRSSRPESRAATSGRRTRTFRSRTRAAGTSRRSQYARCPCAPFGRCPACWRSTAGSLAGSDPWYPTASRPPAAATHPIAGPARLQPILPHGEGLNRACAPDGLR